MKTNYHRHQVLKTADPKLRKAIISNCNKVVVHCIIECILTVLNGNIKLTGCDTRKLKNTRRRFAKYPTDACLSPRRRNVWYSVGIPVAPIECLIPADRLHGSLFMSRELAAVSKRKRRGTVKKRNPYAQANKIRKYHPYSEWLKMRKKMDESDLRNKNETNIFAEYLSKVIPTGQASKVSPPPPPPHPMPPPPKLRRGTQTDLTSASVTASPYRRL